MRDFVIRVTFYKNNKFFIFTSNLLGSIFFNTRIVKIQEIQFQHYV